MGCNISVLWDIFLWVFCGRTKCSLFNWITGSSNYLMTSQHQDQQSLSMMEILSKSTKWRHSAELMHKLSVEYPQNFIEIKFDFLDKSTDSNINVIWSYFSQISVSVQCHNCEWFLFDMFDTYFRAFSYPLRYMWMKSGIILTVWMLWSRLQLLQLGKQPLTECWSLPLLKLLRVSKSLSPSLPSDSTSIMYFTIMKTD